MCIQHYYHDYSPVQINVVLNDTNLLSRLAILFYRVNFWDTLYVVLYVTAILVTVLYVTLMIGQKSWRLSRW
jgi:hypothetical protein